MVLLLREYIRSPRIVITSTHTLLCSHTLNCNRFNTIEISKLTAYIRFWRIGDASEIRQHNKPKFTPIVRQVKIWDCDIRDPRICATRYLFQDKVLLPKGLKVNIRIVHLYHPYVKRNCFSCLSTTGFAWKLSPLCCVFVTVSSHEPNISVSLTCFPIYFNFLSVHFSGKCEYWDTLSFINIRKEM